MKSVRFGGEIDCLKASNALNLAATSTVFIVARPYSVTGESHLFGHHADGRVGLQDGKLGATMTMGTSGTLSTPVVVANTWYLFKYRMSDKTEGAINLGVFSQIGTGTPTISTASTLTLGGAGYGTSGGGCNFLNGEIAEIVMYSSALTDADADAVSKYLYTRWFPNPAAYETSTAIARSSSPSVIEVKGRNFGSDPSLLTVSFTPAITVLKIEHCQDDLLLVQVVIGTSVPNGNLNINIVHSQHGSSGGGVKVASLVNLQASPTVTRSTAMHNSADTTLTITGTGFGSATTEVGAYLSPYQGPIILGSVTSISGSSCVILIPGLSNDHVGPLGLLLTVRGLIATPTIVANITATRPAITAADFKMSHSSSGNLIEIHGSNFGVSTAAVFVSLSSTSRLTLTNNGQPLICTDSMLLVQTSTDTSSSAFSGYVYAVVTLPQANSGTPVRVGLLTDAGAVSNPVITSLNLNISSSDTTLTLTGTSFGSLPDDARVYFFVHNSTAPIATVSSSGFSDTSLQVVFSNMSDHNAGPLKVVVSIRGKSSNSTVVGTIIPLRPAIITSCQSVSGDAGSICSTNDNGLYADACTVGAWCLNWLPNNGGCGSSGVCAGNSFKIARSLHGNRIEIIGKRFGNDLSAIQVQIQSHEQMADIFVRMPNSCIVSAGEWADLSLSQCESRCISVGCTYIARPSGVGDTASTWCKYTMIRAIPTGPCNYYVWQKDNTTTTAKIVNCSDSVIIADIADTSSLPLTYLSARVVHSTNGMSGNPLGEFQRIGLVTAAVQPVYLSQRLSPLTNLSQVDLNLFGTGFGSDSNDIRVYITTTAGSFITPSQITTPIDSMRYKTKNVDLPAGPNQISTNAGTTLTDCLALCVSQAGCIFAVFGYDTGKRCDTFQSDTGLSTYSLATGSTVVYTKSMQTIVASLVGITGVDSGYVTAAVGVRGVTSANVLVADLMTPTVREAHFKIVNGAGNRMIEITGDHFGFTVEDIIITFTPTLNGVTVLQCVGNKIVVSAAVPNTLYGELTATVERQLHGDSGPPVKVAYIHTPITSEPTAAASSAYIYSNQEFITIQGTNFGDFVEDLRVYLVPANGGKVGADVVAFASTNLTIRVQALDDDNHGNLTAFVTVRGNPSPSYVDSSSEGTVIGNVVTVRPNATSSSFSIAQSSPNTFELYGERLNYVAANMMIQFHPEIGNFQIEHCEAARVIVAADSTSSLPTGSLQAVMTHTTNGTSKFSSPPYNVFYQRKSSYCGEQGDLSTHSAINTQAEAQAMCTADATCISYKWSSSTRHLILCKSDAVLGFSYKDPEWEIGVKLATDSPHKYGVFMDSNSDYCNPYGNASSFIMRHAASSREIAHQHCDAVPSCVSYQWHMDTETAYLCSSIIPVTSIDGQVTARQSEVGFKRDETAVVVGNVIEAKYPPAILTNISKLDASLANVTTLNIYGLRFGTVPSNIKVHLYPAHFEAASSNIELSPTAIVNSDLTRLEATVVQVLGDSPYGSDSLPDLGCYGLEAGVHSIQVSGSVISVFCDGNGWTRVGHWDHTPPSTFSLTPAETTNPSAFGFHESFSKVVATEVRIGSAYGIIGDGNTPQTLKAAFTSSSTQCFGQANTVYINGNDCGAGEESCVLGVASNGPPGDFFYNDATCYGRCDKNVAAGACSDSATPTISSSHPTFKFSNGIWVRIKPQQLEVSIGSVSRTDAWIQGACASFATFQLGYLTTPHTVDECMSRCAAVFSCTTFLLGRTGTPDAGQCLLAKPGCIKDTANPNWDAYHMKRQGQRISDEHNGALRAAVFVSGMESNIAQVATVVGTAPLIQSANFEIAASAVGSRIEIQGDRFYTVAGDINVAFLPSMGTVSIVYCSQHLVVVDIGADTTQSSTPDDILVQVTHNTYGQFGVPVKIGKLIPPVVKPLITASTVLLPVSTTELVIAGSNFIGIGTNAAAVRVYLTATAGVNPLAVVTACTNTYITISIQGLVNAHAGALLAVVTVGGVKSTPIQVAIVVEVQYLSPIVGSTCRKFDATGAASTCDVNGDGAYNQACAEGVLCDPSASSNGGCGATGKCFGQSFVVAKSGSGNRIELQGRFFGAMTTHVSVMFEPYLGVVEIVSCVDNLIVADIRTSTLNVSTGNLRAKVEHHLYGSSGAFKVIGTVASEIDAPAIYPNDVKMRMLGTSLTSVTIYGQSFSTNVDSIRVYLEPHHKPSSLLLSALSGSGQDYTGATDFVELSIDNLQDHQTITLDLEATPLLLDSATRTLVRFAKSDGTNVFMLSKGDNQHRLKYEMYVGSTVHTIDIDNYFLFQNRAVRITVCHDSTKVTVYRDGVLVHETTTFQALDYTNAEQLLVGNTKTDGSATTNWVGNIRNISVHYGLTTGVKFLPKPLTIVSATSTMLVFLVQLSNDESGPLQAICSVKGVR